MKKLIICLVLISYVSLFFPTRSFAMSTENKGWCYALGGGFMAIGFYVGLTNQGTEIGGIMLALAAVGLVMFVAPLIIGNDFYDNKYIVTDLKIEDNYSFYSNDYLENSSFINKQPNNETVISRLSKKMSINYLKQSNRKFSLLT